MLKLWRAWREQVLEVFSEGENLLKGKVLCVLSKTATRGPRLPGVSSESKPWTSLSPTDWKKIPFLFKQPSECDFVVFPLRERIGDSSREAQRAQKYMDLCDDRSIINVQTFSRCETVRGCKERQGRRLCFILHIQKPFCRRNRSNQGSIFAANTGRFPQCIYP